MSRVLKVFVIGVVLLVAWLIGAPLAAKNLIVEKRIDHADVIFVLSGSAVYKERNAKAAAEFKKGIADKVLLSDDGGEAGWSRVEERNPKFYELAKTVLVNQGVPKEAILVLDADVDGTNDEAAVFKTEARKNGWQSVLIVTSAYHSRRALSVFEGHLEGTDIKVGIASPPTGEQTPPPFTWWMTPKGWVFVAGEYLKTLYYWVFY